MKTLNSLLTILLTLIVCASCSTDDLKKDIDDLKGRVTSMEAQVNLLNDNMNTLRIFIDGNKTISTVETTGTAPNQIYKLTLSDGQTVTLTQGSTGSVSTPDITINENGYWVINGKTTDKKAVGNDAPTPSFRIEDSTSYWQVSYDNGDSWTYVRDTTGQPVKATAETGDGTGDSFFKDVKVNGQTVEVTLNDGHTYALPIVEDLACEIEDPDTNYADGIWTVGYGKTVTTRIKVKGDNILANAPAGWTVKVEVSDVVTGEGILTVTAPASGAVSRAVADNTKDITVQVNKGIYWAVDKIQVEAGESLNSYQAMYEAGKDITVGGMTINKATYGESHLLTAENSAIAPTGGVYFVAAGAAVNYTATTGFKQLILIGDDPSQKSTLNVKQQIKVIDNTDGEDVLVLANLNVEAGSLNNYLLVQNGNTSFNKVVFHKCNVTLTPGKNLTYISSSARSIEHFTLDHCRFDFNGASSVALIAASSSTASYGTLTFRNNVFYSKADKQLVKDFKLFSGAKASVNKIIMENNTFVNTACNTNFYVNANVLSEVEVQKNLFYMDTALDNAGGLFRVTTAPTGSLCKDNIVYKTEAENPWQAFFGGIKNGFEGAEEINVISDNPFDGGTFNLSAGSFIPSSSYTSYGAKVD